MNWCRRRVLHGLGASLSGLASCALPSGVKPKPHTENNVLDSGDTENNVLECFRTEYTVAEWLDLPFPEELREVGAAVPYAVPERFLHLLLIHHRPGVLRSNQRGPASRPIPAYILETTEEGLRLGLPAD